jgi:hypothetical protein
VGATCPAHLILRDLVIYDDNRRKELFQPHFLYN